MKSIVALMSIFLLGVSAHAQVELSCKGVGAFSKTGKSADVKVAVESRENRCMVEIKFGDAVASRGWRVDCPLDGNFAIHVFEPENGDFQLELGEKNSLVVFYRSGNTFATSQLDCNYPN